MRRGAYRSIVFCGLFLTLAGAWPGFAWGSDFGFKVLGFPADLLPGLGVEVRVDAANISGHPIVFPRAHSVVEIEVRRDDGSQVSGCSEWNMRFLFGGLPPDWKGWLLPPDWSTEYKKMLCFESPGEYTVRYFIESQGPYYNENGEEYQAWEGEVTTPLLRLVIKAPEGIDREVFDTFDYDSLVLGKHSAEILRRFPTSTYAAYVIWELGAKGILTMDLDRTVRYLNGSVERMWASIPFGDDWQSLKGSEFLNWRDSSFEQALETHPDIWFAGELRYVLALDDYLLGDKASCAARLEDLSEHAKPYVAENAQALLKAMKAKDMLPGDAKDFTVPQAKAPASGSAEQ